MTTTSITVVTCVEAGYLEGEVVTMIGSLRRWGGALADAPVIAVTPRLGPPLRPETRRALRELDVTHVASYARHQYGWNPFMNKPRTLQMAAPHVRTTHGLWLDGDVLVLSSPEALLADPEVRFMACVEEMGPISDGPANQFDPFWVAIGMALGFEKEGLPWVNAPFSPRKIRAYCNSGVFRYRTGCGIEDAYEAGFRTLLDSHLIPKDDPSIFLHEQISLAQVAARDYGFHELPLEYNFHVGPEYEHLYQRETFGIAKLVHYHRVLRSAKERDRFIALLEQHRPDVAAFVRESPASRDSRPVYWKAPHKLLRFMREREQKRHLDACVRV